MPTLTRYEWCGELRPVLPVVGHGALQSFVEAIAESPGSRLVQHKVVRSKYECESRSRAAS